MTKPEREGKPASNRSDLPPGQSADHALGADYEVSFEEGTALAPDTVRISTH